MKALVVVLKPFSDASDLLATLATKLESLLVETDAKGTVVLGEAVVHELSVQLLYLFDYKLIGHPYVFRMIK